MKRRNKIIFFWVISLLWLLLMWRLSSADGGKTLEDSMKFAKIIARIFYDNPNFEQLNQINLFLRKCAHIFLYIVLGFLASAFWNTILERKKMYLRGITAFICCTIIAFADELQKLPIPGRHFDFGESVLNTASSGVVILFLFLGKFLWQKLKTTRPDTSGSS